MMPRSIAALLTLTVVALGATPVAAQDKLDRALREGKAAGRSQNVILKAREGYEGWARQLLAQKGKSIDAELPSIGAVAANLSPAELDAICKHPAFSGCSEDSAVSSSAAMPSRARTIGVHGNATKVFTSPISVSTLLGTLGIQPSSTFGMGVTVAVIDSGIHPSSAFAGRIKAFYDFTLGGVRGGRPFDDYGHGTHVAGLIGGLQSFADVEYQGVAPGVQFVSLKVLDKNGGGKTSDVIRAIEFAIANKAFFGIDIINLSLGHPIFEPSATDPLVQAVEKASKAGIIVVASAGNFGVNKNGVLGYAGITSPGNAPSALTVGAANHRNTIDRTDDRMAPYSSNGPTWYDGLVKPDFVAPGHMLASEASPKSSLFLTYPALQKKGKDGKTFLQLSGTSMSAAVVSGVVAGLKQADRRLTPNLAKAVLQFTAIPMRDDAGAVYGPLRQGTGEVNARGALDVVRSIDYRNNTTSVPWLNLPNPHATTIGDRSYLWASNIVWADNIVWGDSIAYNLPIFGLNIVWGDNVAWTDAATKTTNVVWGDNANIVWGDNIVWGENIVWGNITRATEDNIVWGNADDNIVWGNCTTAMDDNIVWGNLDNIVWGNCSTTAKSTTTTVKGNAVLAGGRR